MVGVSSPDWLSSMHSSSEEYSLSEVRVSEESSSSSLSEKCALCCTFREMADEEAMPVLEDNALCNGGLYPLAMNDTLFGAE